MFISVRSHRLPKTYIQNFRDNAYFSLSLSSERSVASRIYLTNVLKPHDLGSDPKSVHYLLHQNLPPANHTYTTMVSHNPDVLQSVLSEYVDGQDTTDNYESLPSHKLVQLCDQGDLKAFGKPYKLVKRLRARDARTLREGAIGRSNSPASTVSLPFQNSS